MLEKSISSSFESTTVSSTENSMLTLLKQCQLNQQIRPIDFHFAKFMAELGADNLMQLAAALTSQQLGGGHICLPIDKMGGLFHQHCLQLALDSQQVSERLNVSCIFHDPQQTHYQLNESLCCGDDAPLRLQYSALFMARYAEFEQLISDKLLQPISVQVDVASKGYLEKLFTPQYGYLWNAWQSDTSQSIQALCEKYLDVIEQASVDWPAVQQCFTDASSAKDLILLESLIPNKVRCDWQKISAALALTSPRCIISGGPGTGKTTTVVKLLALLLNAQPDLMIKMVAPTGKAAARLTESITNALDELDLGSPADGQKAPNIPTDASTIHRLLGVRNNSAHFRHHAGNQLTLDLLLVDEASMVDLPLMAKLLSALPDHARLILLGDKDQLASVEAGAVLGDICSFIDSGYSQQKAQQLAELTGFDCLLSQGKHAQATMSDNLCLLRKSYRFDQYSGIGYLASAVNKGGVTAVKLAALCEKYDDLAYYANDAESATDFDRLVVEGYTPYLSELCIINQDNRGQAKVLLSAFNDFKILCATREQEWGVNALNHRCEKLLQKAGLLVRRFDMTQTWYVGRPVMVTENSYHLGLFNGDIGLCLEDEHGQLRVYFVMPDGSVADFQPSRLPAHQTVFAMTVHKSQGSEFKHTLLALPDYALPVMNRELIYTGITRAKKRLTLIADLALVASSVRNRASRNSRLTERLTTN
ncbi:exodeoxyribonuclease V subunit alpha [Psychromonas sp. 14N.309.X.WAT.B.A12]|uniref:exodeoxyribonuclease V subunit alpha n=1 Tax=Psychromonas sp. 14N.309.X.WAT.B.A12 TaxID=2998322 RepID=UPI0025AF35B3|nr:exodeoxyribonuclease V subunit alpha [Psychromonas sp. 14N.309.X.WAT.B.A12]MDN2662361.1 exodeoxyribonuclease V subunit alpha [Psychromonas sp. 14N.309.X.WAT.B.A12]